VNRTASQVVSMCAGKVDVVIDFVHIPKSGGMSVVCTYNSMPAAVRRQRGGSQGCQHVQSTAPSVHAHVVGVHHDTYADFARDRLCPELMCRKGGESAVSQHTCRPLMTFMAHPEHRFLSAFFQEFGKGPTSRLKRCGFLNCRTDSVLWKRLSRGDISPEEYALWKERGDVVQGFNEATKMLGLDTVTNGRYSGSRLKDITLEANSTEGRKALARAKGRLNEMDAVGMTHDFERAMRVTSWQLGIPLLKICSCNINPFKKYTVAGVHFDEPYLSTKAKEKLMHDNALDLELFHHADMLYRRSVDRYDATLMRLRPPKEFTCKPESTRCKVKAGKGGPDQWVPLRDYKKQIRQVNSHGTHPDCSFTCVRSESDLELKGD